MPSPFPGMDPFLEAPAEFSDLHNGFIVYMSELLHTKMAEPYYAKIGCRAWVEISEHGIEQDEVREPFLEVYTRDGGERLVTSIEVLSPSDKTPGDHGRDLYLRKQREILDSKVHLVEIDLLRGGTHTTAVPLKRALRKTGPFDYHVCVRPFDRFEDYLVYPFLLQDRMPEIAVPLLPGNLPVPLDLQAVFDRCYDAGAYRRHVRYRDNAPVPPLRPEQAEWATRLLREQGLLSA